MQWRGIVATGLCGLMLASLALYGTGCRIGSADSVGRNVGINVGGVYRNSGSRIISQHTGAAITEFNLIQDGERLQAIDNNGLIFKGKISSTTTESSGQSPTANFSLKGQTTDGNEGIISGSISVSGTQATMRGTWAEPSTFGNVLGFATVAPMPSPQPTNNVGTNTNTGTNNVP